MIRCKYQLITEIILGRNTHTILFWTFPMPSNPWYVPQRMWHFKNFSWKKWCVFFFQFSASIFWFAIFQENYIYLPYCLCYVIYIIVESQEYFLFSFSISLPGNEFLLFSLGKWFSCWWQISLRIEQNYEKGSLQICK